MIHNIKQIKGTQSTTLGGGWSLGCDEDGLLFRVDLTTRVFDLVKLLHICKTQELPSTLRSTRSRQGALRLQSDTS
ncbi:hypothetical protein PFLUV_G00133250 [Perca fluviatilis]|uniref:Uncharacterized protein n=1 Tax=Perca fluviatilis TaxID=8168 RepID=A0A6A5E4P3_PERFL|nr:hypothetical protein PFLUV_G00133250 [Perca fluviatilis]